MDHSVITILVIMFSAKNRSFTMAAPTQDSDNIPDLGLMIEWLLEPQVVNTTVEPQQQLTELYVRLAVFQTPLGLAYSSEPKLRLKMSIKETNRQLRDAVQATQYLLQEKWGVHVLPHVKTVKVVDMNSKTKYYLGLLLKYHQITGLTSITSDVVESYRNYIIAHTLLGALRNLRNCIPST